MYCNKTNKMEVKYKHEDFNRLLNAFINIQSKGRPENLTAEDIDPLLEYPEPVISEFINALDALSDDIVDRMATSASTRGAVEIYILMRMNLVKVPDPNDNPDI